MKKINKICLRTKIEVCITTLLLMLIFLASVVTSVDRTISNTNDDIYTFIRNSNGNYWEATGSNIQQAIWDLNGTGGTVHLPATTLNVSSTIILEEHVELFMYNTKLYVTADVNVIEPKAYTEIAGGEIDVSYLVDDLGTDYTSSCIFVDAENEINTKKSLYVHDIKFTANSHGWTDYCSGSAIELFGGNNGNIYSAMFSNLWIRNFNKAIFINASGSSIQGNIFTDIWIHNCVHGIWIEGDGWDRSGLNTFVDFSIQPTNNQWSVDAIYVEGESNLFKGIICDAGWFLDSDVVKITEDARATMIITSMARHYIKDNQNHSMGWGGVIISGGTLDFNDFKTEHINYGDNARSINFFQNANSPQYFSIWAPNNNRGYIYVTNTSMAIKYPMSATGAGIVFTDDKVVNIDDVLKLDPRATAPSSPEEGMLYVNSTDHHIYCYLNGTWVQLD